MLIPIKVRPRMDFHSPVGASTSERVWQKLARYQHRHLGISVDQDLRVRRAARHHHQRGEEEGPDRENDRPEGESRGGLDIKLRLREGPVEELRTLVSCFLLSIFSVVLS